jgi:hypothetical protein
MLGWQRIKRGRVGGGEGGGGRQNKFSRLKRQGCSSFKGEDAFYNRVT